MLNKYNVSLFGISKKPEQDLGSYQLILKKINNFHQKIENNSNEELKLLAGELREKALKGNSLDDLLVEFYAILKEVCFRQLGITPYDVQIIAAIALHEGKLVEMNTGEGKTLAAVFPACLNALTGKGVHVLTFNDYLARRDAQWMEPVFQFMGLSVGAIQAGQTHSEKKNAYLNDITYATAKEVGFDYLRSFIAYEKDDNVLRPLHYVLVDEADAILIDEARNPLILAGNILESDQDFYRIARFVKKLDKEKDFVVDKESGNVFLTERGAGKAEKHWGVFLQKKHNYELQACINLALQAKNLLKKDIDYVVKDGKIMLIDDFTGRIVKDRKWRNGLQTAVEAKENLTIYSEGAMLNSITLQHFIQKYSKLAGMTATAQPSQEEFANFYHLEIVTIPPNKKCIREDLPDLLFTDKESRDNALINEICTIHETGQPLLIGTLTVKESEILAERLKPLNVPCFVLNARNDEMEAEIIAKAGRSEAVTIATNMAGRGTDIVLGGGEPADRKKVIELGGLYVIGTNRHESRRVDQQLKGRAGRQGDVGKSRFFISFEDDLMIRFKLKEIMPKKYRHLKQDGPIRNKKVLDFIDITQHIIENRFFDLRKHLYEYSSFIETQRIIFHQQRQRVLFDDLYFQKKINETSFKKEIMPEWLNFLNTIMLFCFDKYWALHLDQLSQIRESIHIVRLGGQHPLREFRKKADKSFKDLNVAMQKEIREKIEEFLADPSKQLSEFGIKKPSSTWSFVINDNPFSDQLSIMLLDNSNIGFQADVVSAFFLFLFSLIRKAWPGKS